jgi:hypothetical protein
MVGAKFVRAQSLIVTGVLAGFAVFICVTIFDINPGRVHGRDRSSSSCCRARASAQAG